MYLIQRLLNEKKEYSNIKIPDSIDAKKTLLRSLMNVRMAMDTDDELLEVQDEYLREEIVNKGIVTLQNMEEVLNDIYIWRGDITRIKADAIVNAANSGMTGCYVPNHNCIDNCIHTYAGMELRSYCADMMRRQGHEEATGEARITPAYNLPCNYIIHTVGPIVQGRLKNEHEELLKKCYESCLLLAQDNDINSIAFCCISTGVFGFPNDRASKIAVNTVMEYKRRTKSKMKVIFNVFKEEDEELYRREFERQITR